MRTAGLLLMCIALTACIHGQAYSDLELFQKAAQGETVHCWKRDSVESGPFCHHSGFEEPLHNCLLLTGRTDWPADSLEMAPGTVLACMAIEGWQHTRLEVTSAG